MIFSIRDLSFELGSVLLEGWFALAARAGCALLILLAAWLVRRWLSKRGIPALLARKWYFNGTPILLRSFAVPIQRMCTAVGVYLAAASLPWAIPGIAKLLLVCFRLVMTLLVCEGLYAASDLADLLLASCSPEIRSNKTLCSLLDTAYKEGEVIDINFRSTRIRSLDKTINVVTNSKICSSTVQNAALRTMRPYKFNLGVTYGTTRPKLEQLMKDLQTMLDASPYTNKGTNIVQLANFGDSSINILVSAYLLTNAYAEFLQMQNDLNLNIMDIMQADGVDFAFPSTSVYIEKN